MHMADALISPVVGGTVWAATAGTLVYCSNRVRKEIDDRKIPLMGVLGAFIFAAQMINFTIPATGSSGHLGGGMILTILLGPHAAFLTIASVLTVQALFFADGGLLALGCNIFNLGFFPAFIAYPLIYRKLAGNRPTKGKIVLGSVLSAVAGLQLGAFGVILQTVFSGVSALPFPAFTALMLPIHLAIGLVEGFVTAAVISFVYKARPDIMTSADKSTSPGIIRFRYLAASILVIALVTGGFISRFASDNPDGLEWAIGKVAGTPEIEGNESGVHRKLAEIQEKSSVLPDYGFRDSKAEPASPAGGLPASSESEHDSKTGTGLAGLVGGLMSLLAAGVIGFILKKFSIRESQAR